jgi:hypothetical protein
MDADAGEAAVKRRQRIDRPHISIAIRQSGEGMRAVSVICQSPASAGVQPADERDKRIFFCQSAICLLKKD